MKMTDTTLKRSKKTWRNSSPSPLLLSRRDMEIAILKERMRCDRHAQYFSLISIQIIPTIGMDRSRQMRLVARALRKRLRLTDEKGLLLKGGLGVLLPMTNLNGARVVQNAIVDATELVGIQIESSIFTYSGKDDFDVSTNSNSYDQIDSEHGSENDNDSDNNDSMSLLSNDGTSAESVRVQSISASSTVTMRAVRADSESQIRPSNKKQLTNQSTVATTLFCPRYPVWKRISDMVGAAIGLFIASPIILIAALAIKLNSKGPVLFKQMRTGQFGNPFAIYKLRTMVVDAEELKAKLQQLNERDGPAFKIKKDPRVTSVGKFLRMTGIDELPQLWNILIGDMAIVGPRPLPCNEDAQCKTWQRRRLDTKPGLTCIWQISKSREISFEDWMRMDLKYSGRRSIRSDVSLVFKTVMAVVLGRVGH
jgi:lipopolysaccharide/colanic/teichoic acid biosynthesis glycosyltransferase